MEILQMMKSNLMILSLFGRHLRPAIPLADLLSLSGQIMTLYLWLSFAPFRAVVTFEQISCSGKGQICFVNAFLSQWASVSPSLASDYATARPPLVGQNTSWAPCSSSFTPQWKSTQELFLLKDFPLDSMSHFHNHIRSYSSSWRFYRSREDALRIHLGVIS